MKTRIIILLGGAASLALAAALSLAPTSATAATCEAAPSSQEGAVPIAARGFIETSPAWVSMRQEAPPWAGTLEPETADRGRGDHPLTVLAGRGGYNSAPDRGWVRTPAPQLGSEWGLAVPPAVAPGPQCL